MATSNGEAVWFLSDRMLEPIYNISRPRKLSYMLANVLMVKFYNLMLQTTKELVMGFNIRSDLLIT